MNFLKEQILRLENGSGRNLPWRRAFNLALRGGGGNPLQNLAENTPELFLKVLDFTENKDILPLHVVDLAKDIKWDVLLRSKFPQDFKSKEDIKAKFEWLSEYEPKDINAIAKMFLRSKKKKEKDNDNTIGKKRKREEEEEIIFQSKALKCFYYWTKGWSKVLRAHGLGQIGDKIERDHGCQCKL